MKAKSEARQHVQNFVKFAETQHACSVKTIRTDNGPEFTMPTYYASKGILHQTSCVESPQQNGRVERKHQQILNILEGHFSFNPIYPKKFGPMLSYMLFL
jgi:hypothetical protein